MDIAIITDGVVDQLANAIFRVPVGSTAVVVEGLDVNVNDLYDATKGGQAAFSANPQAADLAATAAKKAEIKAAIDAVETTAELKTVVAAIAADVNPGP